MQLGHTVVHRVQVGLHRVDVGAGPLQQQDDVLELGHHPGQLFQLLHSFRVAVLQLVQVQPVFLQDGLVSVVTHLLIQLGGTGVQLGNAVLDLGGGVQQGGELVGGGRHAVQGGLHLGQSRLDLGGPAGQLARLAVQGVKARLHLGNAVCQRVGTVVQLYRTALQPVQHAGQVGPVQVEVQPELHAVQRDGVHGKVGHVGGHGHVAVRTWQQDVGELLVAAHIGHGGPISHDVLCPVGVQRHGHLQGILVKEISGAIRVAAHLQADGQRAAFAAQLFRGDLGPVQRVGQLHEPRQRGGGVHGALIVELAVLGNCSGDGVAAVLQRVGGGHVAHGGIAAMVGDGVPRLHGKAVHSVHAGHGAGRIQIGIDNLFLGGGRKGRQGGPSQQTTCQHQRRCPAHNLLFHLVKPPSAVFSV